MTTVYVPGTEEQDQKKIIMSLQQIGPRLGAAEDDIATLQVTIPASGQIVFPATQNASADANTLDDYEEGTWTPSFTFATAGDLSVTFSQQAGAYIKIGKLVMAWFNVVTSAFTWTTSAGNLTFNTLPFTVGDVLGGVIIRAGSVSFDGVTKAGYTNAIPSAVQASTQFRIAMSGSGVATANIVAADMPTGGTPAFKGVVTYLATA